ncbi:hypothetical protein K435DRAFT_835920 [Dendrothele bispora CBS 962.96]|uniref:Uncharacterized protein n=1 Tax=Dendrothele bispora (strain CBS 962.96) TaxID=1314807 RepID=A0A4S8MKM2_DENBC|nr:hypothetical protein K435DRAFT_835920 [Dendrothele bispora CBS 962.96]
MSVPALQQHLYTFPPFPKCPEGVQITPFTEYQENGIQVFSADGREIDGLGIPTVELKTKHDTDEGKTEARPKKSKTAIQPQVVVGPDGTKSKKYPEWYNAWAETESSRIGYYDQKADRTDRIHAASKDFERGRPWPPVSTGIRAQWDQMRLFIGILVNIPVWHKVAKEDDAHDDEDGVDDDTEDDEEEFSKTNINLTRNQEERSSRPKVPFKRPKPRPPYANYGKEPTKVKNDEEIKQLFEGAKEERVDKLIDFLSDPAKAVQIYLSSYMRRQGLHFSQVNLTAIPRLWRFYIEYLLRSRALSEPEYEEGFRNALKYIELAAEELPKTSEIAKAIPDGLCNAFRECFEIKRREHQLMTEELAQAGTSNAPMQFQIEVADDAIETPEVMEEVFNESLEAGNIQIVNSDLGADTTQSATITEVTDDDPDGVMDATSGNASYSQPATGTQNGDGPSTNQDGWGSSWGDGVNGTGSTSWGNGWGDSENGNTNNQADNWGAPSNLDWAMPEPDSLIKFLGPTLFPLTHTSGVMEWSVRRIKSVIAPPPPSQVRMCPVLAEGEEPDGEAVEVELEQRFSKVVLEPWIGWECPEEEPTQHMPCIQPLSRGKVVVKEGIVFEGRRADDAVTLEDVENGRVGTGGLKPHDALEDNITVFLEKSTADKLKIGMGLGGQYIQLARVSDLEDTKSKSPSTRYWFIERTTATLTSYHTV